MRTKVNASRLQAISNTPVLLALSILVAGCSNDAIRFEDALSTQSSLTSNQHAIIHGGKQTAQPYPGDVARQNVQRGGVVRASQGTSYPKVTAQPLAPAVARAPLSAAPATSVSDGYEQAEQKVVTAAPRQDGAIVLKPRQGAATKLKVVGEDDIVTGSVRSQPTPPPKPEVRAVAKPVTEDASGVVATGQPKPAAKKPVVGWDGSKGTWVSVRSGETLYNLSRRYGVPVKAIRAANSMADSDGLAAGSKVLIPTYTYGASAKVSAPDNDPTTKASRSSRGFQGEARQGRLAIPSKRAKQVLKPVESVVSQKPADKPEEDKAPKVAVKAEPVSRQGGGYTVQSGDTLRAIARRHGSSADAIRQANGISGNLIRVGQDLIIPVGDKTVRVVKAEEEKPAKQVVDAVTTGSIPAKTIGAGKASQKVTTAEQSVTIASRAKEKISTPAKTSSREFRWPARGRVIVKFGERLNGGANDGIDISVPEGTPIKASENGTVIYSGAELEDFGKLVLLSHDGGWVSAYAHASATMVKRGDKVRRGQVIAKSGRTGNATVPKLHFELRKDSNPVNPLRYLSR